MSFKMPWTSVIETVGGLLDKVIPDPQAKAAAILELRRLEQDGALEADRIKLSAILAEANSTDPYTSRARPSFLYVVYVMILFAIPMGFLSAFSPDTAKAVATGLKDWLAAIPPDLYELFKWVMLGYIGGRSIEKVKGAA